MNSGFDLHADPAVTQIPGGIETLNEFALSGGKKFRPILLMNIARCLSLSEEVASPYSIAAERIHNATLLHDDVIDESRLRRGKATLNATGENKKAVLAGDLLLARTLSELSRSGRIEELRDLFEVLVELTEGEWLQLEAKHRLDIGERHLREVARKKTGSLIGWCCATPARLGGYSAETVRSLREFGVQLGVAFQMVDDCSDFDPASGKPLAQDLSEGQVNFVVQQMLAQSPSLRPEIEGLLRSPKPSVFSDKFRQELAVASRRTFRKVELELAAARATLERSGLGAPTRAQIRQLTLRPFELQLEAVRARVLGEREP